MEAMVCHRRRGLATKKIILAALRFGQGICQHGFHLELMWAEAQAEACKKLGKKICQLGSP